MEGGGNRKMPQPETVADYLAKPTGASWIRRAGDGCAALCLCSWALLVAIWAFQGKVFADFGVLSAETLDLRFLIMPLVIAGIVFAFLVVMFRLVEKVGGFAEHDDLGAIKRAVLSIMLSHPRFGISTKTPMSCVSLNADHLFKGAEAGAVRCWSGRVPFVAEDFAGAKAADFGGVDFMCVDGKLYVFLTVEAKRRFIEARSKKGGVSR